MFKILVVDDEPNIQKLYSEELEKEGYEVVCAGNIEEAMKAIEAEDPSLLVLDIKLKEESGIDLLLDVAKRDKKLPIILNSAYSVYKDNFQTWAADAYIVKSVDLTPLKEKIKELLEKRSV
ncbi:response regulator [bacterium]|nr:MAG: response regulator [bacterium]